MKACSASSNASLPRDCEKRWTLGVQPPLIAMRSQAIASPGPADPSDQRLATKACDDAQMAARADDGRARLDAQARLARRFRPFAFGLSA